MSEPTMTTLLEDAIDIPAWLEADGTRPLAERMHRDREIGRALGAGDAASRVRRWWQRIGDRGEAVRGHRLHQARSLINLSLALIGLAAGSGLALAAFRYDGSYPVNVVRLLALLVVPQVLLLALNLFLIPGRVPGLRFVQDALSALNPGALAAAVYRQITGHSGSGLFAWATAPGSAMRRLGKWQMLTWSQIAAVALNTGVLATAVVLIAFTDLAFGWTTTLDVDSSTATTLFDAIAAPWSGLFPGSVPGPDLVESSQYFRLEGYAQIADSRTLTGWWSFTVLAVITYGLLPRVAFLIVAGWRLRVATRNLLLSDARVAALLDRMSAPELQTQGTEERAPPLEPPPQIDAESGHAGSAAAETDAGGQASAIIWSQCIDAGRARALVHSRLGFAVTTLLDAGGGTIAEERQSLDQLSRTRDPVVVLTPAWEPPLLEFVDFLGALREIIGMARAIVVVPVAEDGQPISAIEHENWSRAVGRRRDPNLHIDAGGA
jgi:hypothetical protein